MPTFEQVLQRNNGIGPGFDFLRLALSIIIVAFHALILTENLEFEKTPLWFSKYALVPMFFILSGFLITASAMRLSLKNYLINRALRIVPALAVDVTFCALIIGPLITTYSLANYFADYRFRSYFLNILGDIHYFLPGVFEHNMRKKVNGALWTVPYELICYGIMSCFMFFKLLNSPKNGIIITAIIMAAGIFFEYSDALKYASQPVKHTVVLTLIDFGSQLVTSFLFGIIAFQFKRHIPYSFNIFLVCIAICAATAFTMDISQTAKVPMRIILLPALTYITLYIGLTDLKIPGFFKRGDYSYGIYLYHNPLLQAVIYFFPAISAVKFYGAAFVFALGMPMVFIMAYFSWNCVEKPVLSLRKRFSFIAGVRGVE